MASPPARPFINAAGINTAMAGCAGTGTRPAMHLEEPRDAACQAEVRSSRDRHRRQYQDPGSETGMAEPSDQWTREEERRELWGYGSGAAPEEARRAR